MSVSGDVFLQWLIDSGNFNGYNSSGLPAVNMAANVVAVPDPLPVPQVAPSLSETVQAIAEHSFAVNNPSVVVSPVPDLPVAPVAAVYPSFGNVEDIDPDIDLLIDMNLEKGFYDFLVNSGTKYWMYDDGWNISDARKDYEETLPKAAPVQVKNSAVEFIATTGINIMADLLGGSTAPLPMVPTLNVLKTVGVIGEPTKDTIGTVSSITAGVAGGVVGGVGLAGVMPTTVEGLGGLLSYAGSKTIAPLTKVVKGSAKSWIGRSIVMSFVGSAGGLINAYFAQTKDGRPAKTWMNSAKTVEYSNVPAEGFKKSKYPDKFGQTCYYRKIG